MVHIKIDKGLNIPIKGKPEGEIKKLILGGEASTFPTFNQISLNLSSFDETKFKLLSPPGEIIKIGQPLAEDKDSPGRMFVSPASGIIKEIRRGLKRRLLDIVIEVSEHEEWIQHPPIDINHISRNELIERLKIGGIFANIRRRPFNILANPLDEPRSIFVKALESSPFNPPAELQVLGQEKEFQEGLNVLRKLTKGTVHLVYRKDSPCKAFTEASNVQKHTAEGPHPIANCSIHIDWIDPIKTTNDVVWTLNAHDVVSIGHLFLHGRYYNEKVISIAGPGVLSDKVGFFKVRLGLPISALISGRTEKELQRFISGDVLCGHKVEIEDFLGYYDFAFCIIPENTKREFLHFFRTGTDKYSMSKAYLSGHFSHENREYDFTTNQHGEKRAFIDSTLYDKVMPLNVPTMLLVKAIMAEDYETAELLGLLEVDSEDFALPTFVCPSKIEMREIVKKGLKDYASQILQ